MGTRDNAIFAIKYAFVTVQAHAMMGILVSNVPFLANPAIYRVVKKLITDWLTKTTDDMEVAAFFKYIDTRVHGQGLAWSEASDKNWRIQNSNASKEEKLRAEEEFFIAHKNFAKFNT